MVGDGQSLFVRGDNGGKNFPGKLPPEVVEEVLDAAAHAAVVVGRAEEEDVRALDTRAQRQKGGGLVGGVGVEERERILGEIQFVHYTAARAQPFREIMNDDASGRVSVQASDNREDLEWR